MTSQSAVDSPFPTQLNVQCEVVTIHLTNHGNGRFDPAPGAPLQTGQVLQDVAETVVRGVRELLVVLFDCEEGAEGKN